MAKVPGQAMVLNLSIFLLVFIRIYMIFFKLLEYRGMVYCLGAVHVHLYVDLIKSNTNSLTLSLGLSFLQTSDIAS